MHLTESSATLASLRTSTRNNTFPPHQRFAVSQQSISVGMPSMFWWYSVLWNSKVQCSEIGGMCCRRGCWVFKLVTESIADLAGNMEKSIMTIYIIFEVIVTVCRQVSEVHLVNQDHILIPEHVTPLIRLWASKYTELLRVGWAISDFEWVTEMGTGCHGRTLSSGLWHPHIRVLT